MASTHVSPVSNKSAWHVVTKAFFVVCLVLHVTLCPSVATVFVTAAYGALALGRLLSVSYGWSDGDLAGELKTPGIMIFQSHTKRFAAWTLFFALYFALFFTFFARQEVDILPTVTTWIPKAYLGRYTFDDHVNNDLPGDVTDSASVEMRSNPFVWPKETTFTPPKVSGVISNSAGPNSGPLICGAAAFDCYAPRMFPATPPSGKDYEIHPWVPLTSDLYQVHVRVTPPAGTLCADLQVYRVTLYPDGGLAHALDYPSSTIIPGVDATQQKCNIFGNENWCLGVLHAFSPANYTTSLAFKCSGGGGVLDLQLPTRSTDIDPHTGTTGLDVILVTPNTGVETHAIWEAHEEYSTFLWLFKQFVHDDSLRSWRESTDNPTVCIRFIIAISPVLICWYYLTLRFEQHVCSGGVVLLWVMILLPATLLFVSVGAWIPAVGGVACVIAINNRANSGDKRGWGPLSVKIRHGLLFLMASCNSIQFVWLIVLIAQAGYSAFLYDLSLRQLYSMSYSLIISSGAPASFVALMLPSTLALTLSFMLGAVLCLVMELINERKS